MKYSHTRISLLLHTCQVSRVLWCTSPWPWHCHVFCVDYLSIVPRSKVPVGILSRFPRGEPVVVNFSWLAKIWGECSTIHSPPTPFFFFFKVEISARTLIPLLCQDKSTVAQRAETTVTECSSTSCALARFRRGFHPMPAQRHSQPTPTSLGPGCMRLSV